MQPCRGFHIGARLLPGEVFTTSAKMCESCSHVLLFISKRFIREGDAQGKVEKNMSMCEMILSRLGTGDIEEHCNKRIQKLGEPICCREIYLASLVVGLTSIRCQVTMMVYESSLPDRQDHHDNYRSSWSNLSNNLSTTCRETQVSDVHHC